MLFTQDIKEVTLAKLSYIQSLCEKGACQEADNRLRDIIDDLLQSAVTIVYSREEMTSRPGECEDASQLVAMNID